MTTGLATGWMLGATPTGLVALGPDVDVDIAGDPDRALTLTEALAGRPPGLPTDGPSNGDPDLDALAAQLRRLGAFGVPDPLPEGCSLAAALLEDRAGRAPAGVVWTAEEALLLPPDLPAPERSRALRAFAAGLRPESRRAAYGALLDGRGSVHGDAPDRDRLNRRIATTGGRGDTVAVVELADDGARWTVGPGGVDAIDTLAPHRLGPIRRITDPVPVTDDDPALLLCLAEVAGAGTAVTTATPDRLVQGVGTAERAVLVARAEAAERYAAGDTSRARLRRSCQADLPGALDPRDLFRRDPADPADAASCNVPRLWAPARAHDGSVRWVPAETVYLSLPDAADPSILIPWSSSGMAAHTDPTAARERALAELVERDAFVWTWTQRIARERVTAGIPDAALEQRRTLARHGWTTTWVNLSLDSDPVILCGLTHERRGLVVGAACAPDPAAALERATVEALVLALRFPDDGEPPPAPHTVRTPRDHLRLHLDPARRPDHGFLLEGEDEIELREIPSGHGDDLGERLAALGHAPLTVDLTGPSSAPFSVVRALAPGLLPLTFGSGNEPAGLDRARRPVARRDGREIGRRLAFDSLAGNLPHPFP